MSIQALSNAHKRKSGLRSDDRSGRGYAPVGQTPEIHLSQKKRVRVNFIASLSNQGTVRFMLYTCKLTAKVFILFLERLIRKAERKLFWIVDRHPVHRSQTVKQWFAEHKSQIELFPLPSYSPELNPTEYLNCDRNCLLEFRNIFIILLLLMLLRMMHAQLLPG
jgi:DDE superfamily endonuclease